MAYGIEEVAQAILDLRDCMCNGEQSLPVLNNWSPVLKRDVTAPLQVVQYAYYIETELANSAGFLVECWCDVAVSEDYIGSSQWYITDLPRNLAQVTSKYTVLGTGQIWQPNQNRFNQVNIVSSNAAFFQFIGTGYTERWGISPNIGMEAGVHVSLHARYIGAV